MDDDTRKESNDTFIQACECVDEEGGSVDQTVYQEPEHVTVSRSDTITHEDGSGLKNGHEESAECIEHDLLSHHGSDTSLSEVTDYESDPDEITSDSDDEAESDTEESIPTNSQSVQRGGRSQGSRARIRGEEVAVAPVEGVGEELLKAVEIYRMYQHHVNPLQLQIQDSHFPRSSSLPVTQDHTFHLT